MKIRKARRNETFQNDSSPQKFQLLQSELFFPWWSARNADVCVSLGQFYFFCPEIPLERKIWN